MTSSCGWPGSDGTRVRRRSGTGWPSRSAWSSPVVTTTAAAAWTELGAPYEAALAAVHGDDETRAARAVWDLERLPAAASATRARAVLRERGLNAVPPRRRASTRANPSGLTNRQLDVARLVARGLTNAELARDLYISPKTVDHHVSAVLGRLGLRTRREIVRRAAELGLD